MTMENTSFQTIMNAAEALIREKGCRQTTLQDIIRETGLSKGAIYHYVSSKDELFGLLLKSRIEQMNQRFAEVIHTPETSGLGHPLQLIAEGMVRTSNYQDVTNVILVYLLSQMDHPKVARIVQEVYGFTLRTCTTWIEIGKLHGAIPAELDGEKAAELLVMLMYGLRVHTTIQKEPSRLTVEDLMSFMSRLLS